MKFNFNQIWSMICENLGEKMTLGELYSVICLIFASNFKESIDEKNFVKLAKNWMIKNDNDENIAGQKCWENALKNENVTLIKADFMALRACFDAKYFKIIDENKLGEFFKQIQFKLPFSGLEATHFTNLFFCLNLILKNDKDQKSHTILGYFLSEFFIISARKLAIYLQENAKTQYYKAFGYFLGDFCILIKESLGLKA